ncbi:MAG: DNA-directed RNA polymerase subunit omega [Microcystaceae cyanobacterium]
MAMMSVNSAEMTYRTDKLMEAASNRYRIVVQVAKRAKYRREEERDGMDNPMMKPVIRAVLEMSDELTEPELFL